MSTPQPPEGTQSTHLYSTDFASKCSCRTTSGLQVAQLQQECSGLELLVHNLEAKLRSRTGKGNALPLQQSQPAIAHSTDLLDSTQGPPIAHTLVLALPSTLHASCGILGARMCSCPSCQTRQKLHRLARWLAALLPDAGLSADESIVQLHVERAELHSATGTNFATFVELDFFQHATKATPVMQGPRSVLARPVSCYKRPACMHPHIR